MVLYTCPLGKHGATTPLIKHPCGLAAKALDDTWHAYAVKAVGGLKRVPLSRRGRRDEVRALTGQDDVPLLVLDDGRAILGTSAIVAWASAGA